MHAKSWGVWYYSSVYHAYAKDVFARWEIYCIQTQPLHCRTLTKVELIFSKICSLSTCYCHFYTWSDSSSWKTKYWMAEVFPEVESNLLLTVSFKSLELFHLIFILYKMYRFRNTLMEKVDMLHLWHNNITPYISRHLSIKSFVEDSISLLLHILSPPTLRPVIYLHPLYMLLNLHPIYYY